MESFESEFSKLNKETEEQNREYHENTSSYHDETAEAIAANNEMANNEMTGELAELMEKYEREEWELVDLMEKCDSYENGSGDGKGIQPLKDIKEVHDLAIFYREYLEAKSSDGLPFSEKERQKNPEKIKDLISLQEEFDRLIPELARLNSKKQKLSDQNLEENESEETDKEILNFKNEVKMKLRIKGLSEEIEKVKKSIITPEKKIILSEKSKKPTDPWENVPDFSDEDLRLREDSVKWLKNKKNPQPVYATGEKLSEAEILESAQEYAESNNLPIGNFSVETFNGLRRLVYTKFSVKDKVVSQVKHFKFSDTLPAGKYFFEYNLDNLLPDKKNPNCSIDPVDLMISAARPEKSAQKGAPDKKIETKQMVG